MIGFHKSLTQSDKQKLFVDAPRKNYSANPLISSLTIKLYRDKLYECHQNIVEERKYETRTAKLEQAKNKCLARLNGEKHNVKLQYKDLLKDSDLQESSNTFFMRPGFRYKRNGDPKVTKHNLTEVKARLQSNSLNKIPFSNNAIQIPKLLSQPLSYPSHGGDSEANLQTTRHAILKMEEDVRNIRTNDNELSQQELDSQRDIDVRVRDLKKSLHHTRANFLASKTKQSLKMPDDFEQHYRIKSQAQCNRYSRQCTRPNCVACEVRLKYVESNDKPLRATKSQPIPWKTAPSGVYVSPVCSNNEDNFRTSRFVRKRKQTEKKNSYSQAFKKVPPRKAKSELSTRSSMEYKDNILKNTDPSQTNTGSSDAYIICKNPLLQRFIERESVDIPYAFSLSAENKVGAPCQSDSSIQSITQSQTELPYRESVKSDVVQRRDKSVQHLQSRVSFRKAFSDVLSNRLVQQRKNATNKVEKFLDELPNAKPSITSWRTSDGQIVTWKDYVESKHAEKTNGYRWRPTGQAKPVGKLLNRQQKNPNSYPELVKCRYLRPTSIQIEKFAA